jgi:membrane-anchored glycerophosphoryl diester phosphodiesterase (GDPDase)
LGDIFDGAIKTMRANPQATIGLGFLVGAVFLIPSALVSLWLEGQPVGSSEASRTVRDLLLASLPGLASALAGLLLGGFIAHVVGQAVLGAKAGIAQTWQETKSRIPALIGVNVLTWLAVVLALVVVVIVPGVVVALSGVGEAGAAALIILAMLVGLVVAVWLAIRLGMGGPVTVLERQRVLASLGRSWRLTSGRAFWRILGITLLAGIIAMIIQGVLAVPVAVVTGTVDPSGTGVATSLTTHAMNLVVGALTTPFTAGVGCLLYLDQRIQREALDVTLARTAQQAAGT